MAPSPSVAVSPTRPLTVTARVVSDPVDGTRVLDTGGGTATAPERWPDVRASAFTASGTDGALRGFTAQAGAVVALDGRTLVCNRWNATDRAEDIDIHLATGPLVETPTDGVVSTRPLTASTRPSSRCRRGAGVRSCGVARGDRRRYPEMAPTDGRAHEGPPASTDGPSSDLELDVELAHQHVGLVLRA